MSRTYPQSLVLTGGLAVSLRPLVRTDEAALGAFFAALPPETLQLQREDLRDPAELAVFVGEHRANHTWSAVAADGTGRIVGIGTLHTPFHGWRRHLGEVRTMVAPDCQRQRLGTALLREVAFRARERGLERLQALILASQRRVHDALVRRGFSHEATLHNLAVDRAGQRHDLLIFTHDVAALCRDLASLERGGAFGSSRPR